MVMGEQVVRGEPIALPESKKPQPGRLRFSMRHVAQLLSRE
ncbi:hypothetical protein B8V81_0665 [Paenibacillus pasadenensis]|uniref:Uncharacterized protein n=1 Tax=Paenibacillus pasadenensis TaxID=217090 RepID=A0A2N5NBP5_9BACL|nr:hypothetical protein B8V81_0665 [Paenibacillus pasadenensis]